MPSSIATVAADVRAGRSSPRESFEACLDRIAHREPDVGAFREIFRDVRATPDGQLAGVAIAIKELYDVQGSHTTAGSRVPMPGPADLDAPAVACLRNAGALIVGRTRSHEFAWGITTADQGTRNPLDTALVAGGSSGGSAAAVAYGGALGALGTDTGGSVRVPAAFCGIVGYKPAHGDIPMAGVVALAPSLDHGGVLARTVADAKLLAEIVIGDRRTGRQDLREARRIAVAMPDSPWDGEFLQAFDALAKRLDATPIQLPSTEVLWATHQLIQRREAYHTHTQILTTWPLYRDLYTPGVRDRLAAAAEVTDEQLRAASVRREQLSATIAAAATGFDVVLMPAAPCRPSRFENPDYIDLDGRRMLLRDAVMPHMVAANLTGFPAIVVPVARAADGWPIAAQLLCLPGNESKMFAVAESIEAPCH